MVAKNEDFFWSANEITTVAILGLEQDMNMLWSKNQQGFDRFLSDYSQLPDLKERIRKEISKQDIISRIY